MENTSKQCKLCGNPSVYKEGYNEQKKKTWKGYFCQNKDCGNVEWIKTPKGTGAAKSNGSFNFQTFVADEFAALNKRLDAMAMYLKKHLEKSTQGLEKVDFEGYEKEVNVNEIPFG